MKQSPNLRDGIIDDPSDRGELYSKLYGFRGSDGFNFICAFEESEEDGIVASTANAIDSFEGILANHKPLSTAQKKGLLSMIDRLKKWQKNVN